MEIISSRKNKTVVHMKALGAKKSYRDETGEFYCDGGKLLKEALETGVEITAVLTCDESYGALINNGEITDNSAGDHFGGKALPKAEDYSAVPVYKVTRDIIESISPMKTPQNVVFSCRKPENSFGSLKESKLLECGMGIILENIQDPGNMGTILRTANAFGIDYVMLLGDCADPYGPKAVRASMGAVFKRNIFQISYHDIEEIKNMGIIVYGAALDKESVDFRSVSYDRSAVCIGSEGSGLSERLLDMCSGKVIIPMTPECESLNAGVAASVFMWEMKRGNF